MKTTRFHRSLLVVLALAAASVACDARAWGIGVSIGFAPPPLPVYVQPPCPAEGYLWTPGYWAYDPDDGYYWVPGTWVLAPATGLLWTPGYWGFADGFYAWHAGYWGPRVGFYGGINYGFGYFGTGFAGGYWNRGAFFYNRGVTNIRNVSITNVYNETTVNNRFPEARASYNGGPGGIQLRPTVGEQAAERRPHYGATPEQQHHESAARTLPALRASLNRGQPTVAATPRPGVFEGHGGGAAMGRDATGRRPVEAAASSNGNAVAGRSPQQRQPIDAPEQRAAHQPPAHWAAPALSAPTVQPAQHRAAAPSYPARAPVSYREPVRAAAFTTPRGPGNQAPARSGPPAHASGQGPWHGPSHG
ncbi:MAG TPA: hypothetical protein VH183_10980 [Burkholderiaceae bacterium]|nr:hypothetical protein [Burkholderiaceae bacterium]